MIRYRGRAVQYGELWYDEEAPAAPDVDIMIYRQRESPLPGVSASPFLSLVVDLSLEPGEIRSHFGKDCRYKIRRAEAKDGLRVELIADPGGRLDEFSAFYDTFARQKGVKPADRQWLRAACKARQLALASVSRNGEVLVWHAYVVTRNTAWLQYTGSCFRNRDNDYRALIGRANRWLHWSTMVWFKERGITRYDWGGLFEDESTPERSGINRFKKEFGGRPVRSYDCVVPVTLKGRLWLPLRGAWRSRTTLRDYFAQRLSRAC